jgi:hypothetical protein
MKNLHIIPTDKPSVLILRQDGKLFFTGYGGQLGKVHGLIKDVPQHIYITSDEEIKEDVEQWYLDSFLNKPYNSGGAQYSSKQDVIIMTTDQDLIKDGVQAIDDEFLEWFIKNPSCESVEIENTCLEVRVCDCAMNENCLKPGYKIIVPQEEPKQETLKEAAINNYPEGDVWTIEQALIRRLAFMNGAKWQAERMYSEEELLIAFEAGMMFIGEDKGSFGEWFEQFKKK